MRSSRSSVSATSSAPRRAIAFALALAAMVALPAAAEARKRVVVLDLDGPGGDRVAEQLDLLVARQHATLSGDRFTGRAQHMDADLASEDDVARVARNLAVDGIVLGEIDAREDSYRLTVRLREGRTGAFAHTLAVRLERPELTREAARQIWRMLMPAIDDLPPVSILEPEDGDGGESATPAELPADVDVSGGGDDGASPAEPDATPEREPTPEPAGAASENGEDRVAQREPGAELDGENPLASEPDDGGAASGAGEPAELPAVEIRGGPSGNQRQFSFSHGEVPDEPGSYSGQLAPAAFVDIEAYPFARAREDALAGLGVTAAIDHVLHIRSEFEGVDLPTSQSRMSAGVVYRHSFGGARSDPSLRAGARVNTLRFGIDQEDAPRELDLPDVSYTYIDPGVEGRLPLGDVTAFGELRGMFVLGTGEIQRIEQYGTAQVMGYETGAGLSYAFTDEMHARLGVRLIGFHHSFEGDGDRTDRGAGGDPDVRGATDRYTGAYLAFGYAF